MFNTIKDNDTMMHILGLGVLIFSVLLYYCKAKIHKTYTINIKIKTLCHRTH